MIEIGNRVVMDYEGEPVLIINGVIKDAPAPKSKYYTGWTDDTDYMIWNSETLEWEEPIWLGMNAPYHGLTYEECNTDFRSW